MKNVNRHEIPKGSTHSILAARTSGEIIQWSSVFWFWKSKHFLAKIETAQQNRIN